MNIILTPDNRQAYDEINDLSSTAFQHLLAEICSHEQTLADMMAHNRRLRDLSFFQSLWSTFCGKEVMFDSDEFWPHQLQVTNLNKRLTVVKNIKDAITRKLPLVLDSEDMKLLEYWGKPKVQVDEAT